MPEGTTRSFCTRCGVPLAPAAVFCTKCGCPRKVSPGAAPVATVAGVAGQAVRSASMAGGVVQLVGAGAGFALPWQTVAGAQRADVAAMVRAAALPAAQGLIRSSLRRPGIAMAVTTVLDLVITFVTGGSAALPRMLPRMLTGIATTVMSLVTGSRGGALRKTTGAVAAIGALVAAVTALWGLTAGMLAHTSPWTLLPTAVGAISCLVMAVKTAWAAFRG